MIKAAMDRETKYIKRKLYSAGVKERLREEYIA